MHLFIIEVSFNNHGIYVPFLAITNSTNLTKEYFGPENFILYTDTMVKRFHLYVASRKFVSTMVLTCILCNQWIVSFQQVCL